MPTDTEFAPADRLERSLLEMQYSELMTEGRITEVLDAAPYIAMVTNATRQIIYANRRLLDALGMDGSSVMGRRPGELLGCPNSSLGPGGCGTSRDCRFCGVVHVLLEAMGSDVRVEKEARMFILKDERYTPFEVKITATPMRIAEDRFLVVFMDDISSRKKREQLERTFFHDVMNTAGGVRNLALCLTETERGSEKRLARMILEQSDLLIDEIRSQHLLVEAESDALAVTPVNTSALVLFTEARTAAEMLKEAEGRAIRSVLPDGDLAICTDTVLTRRALLNLLKNALEATIPGGSIRFSMEYQPHSLAFRVHNDAVMDEEVRSQVFQRSFSTKGPGRGLGTYSMRLIVEHYLGGKVSFRSIAGSGTDFRVELPLLCPEPRD